MSLLTLDSKLNGEDLFDGLNDEYEEEIKNLNVVNPVLCEIMKCYQEFNEILEKQYDVYKSEDGYMNDIYNKTRIPTRFSSKNIRQFTILLPYQNRHSSFNDGAFISKLINESDEDEIEIKLKNIDKIDYLGFLNNKIVTIDGNLNGCRFAESMNSGKIILNGYYRQPNWGLPRVMIPSTGFPISTFGGEIHLNGDFIREKFGEEIVFKDLVDLLNYRHELLYTVKGSFYFKGELIVKDGEFVE